MRNKKRLVVLVIVILLVLLTGILLVFRQQKLKNGSLVDITDTVATNIQLLSEVNQNYSNDGFYFFTGSNVAKFNTTSLINSKNSRAVFSEVPFNSASRAVFNPVSDDLFVKIEATDRDVKRYLTKDNQPQTGQFWLYLRKGVEPKLQKFKDARFINDIYIDGTKFYALLYESSTTSRLVEFNPLTSESRVIAPKIVANQFIGVSKNNAFILRGVKGVAWLKDNEQVVLQRKYTASYYDSLSDMVIIQDGLRLNIYNASSKKQLAIKAPPHQFNMAIGRGYILSYNKVVQPNKFALYDIKNDKWVRYATNVESISLQTVLSSARVIQKKPLVVGLVNSTGEMSLLGEAEFSEKQYSYPNIVDGKDYSYSIGSNSFNISSTDKTLNEVSVTVKKLSKVCKCDINQIMKQWINIGDPNKSDQGGGFGEEELL